MVPKRGPDLQTLGSKPWQWPAIAALLFDVLAFPPSIPRESEPFFYQNVPEYIVVQDPLMGFDLPMARALHEGLGTPLGLVQTIEGPG